MELNLTFWGSLFEIFIINLILSGDNAIVIALATLHLEAKDRKKGIFWGTFGAVTLRIILTAGAALLLAVSYLQAIGAIILLWIAVRLLREGENDGQGDFHSPYNLKKAIQTIITADVLMSMDNVLAVAGAAGGNIVLLVIGLTMSIPIVIFGSAFLSSLMRKWPWIISIGSGLLGYTAGEMILNDKSCAFLLEIEFLERGLPWILALAVVLTGNLLRISQQRNYGRSLSGEDIIPEKTHKPAERDLLQQGFAQAWAARTPPKC